MNKIQDGRKKKCKGKLKYRIRKVCKIKPVKLTQT